MPRDWRIVTATTAPSARPYRLLRYNNANIIIRLCLLLMSPRGRALRKGRYSAPGGYYFITAVTKGRVPWFKHASHARAASRTFHDEKLAGYGRTLAFVVMPDHIHWLLELEGELSEAVRLYKALVSVRVGERLWQRGFHDHAIRREEDLRAAARYLVANPLRAGLADKIENYPYWNAVWL